jgi:hypothetical protein
MRNPMQVQKDKKEEDEEEDKDEEKERNILMVMTSTRTKAACSYVLMGKPYFLRRPTEREHGLNGRLVWLAVNRVSDLESDGTHRRVPPNSVSDTLTGLVNIDRLTVIVRLSNVVEHNSPQSR